MIQDIEKTWSLVFGDLATGQMARVRESIVSLSVSYSTSMCTQLSIELIDPGFNMLANNYFLVGRDIIYRSKSFKTTGQLGLANNDPSGNLLHLFEVASVEVRPSQGSSPSIVIQARTKAVQQMKRDKNPTNIKGKGSDFVYWASLQYGLKPLIQKTSKTRQISKASGDRQADSTWDVLSSLASDSKYMLYETDGMLFFCSMDFLMGRWGMAQLEAGTYYNSRNEKILMPINVIPIYWPPISDAERANYHYHGNAQGMESDTSPNPNNIGARLVNIIPLSLPNLRRSDNDPFVVSGSASIDRTAGTMLRPGMTIVLDGIPTFDDIYMITGVNFDHFSTNPVQIEFTKPDREAKYVQTFAVGPTFVDYGNTTDSSALITKTRII